MAHETLSQMGIQNPDEIVRYTLRRRSRRQDVLKISYARKKGSLRPTSRTYEFGRSLQSMVEDSGEPRIEDSYEPSPILLSAVAELDEVLKVKEAGGRKKIDALAEIAALKRLLEDDVPPDSMEVSNRLDRLRDRIQRL